MKQNILLFSYIAGTLLTIPCAVQAQSSPFTVYRKNKEVQQLSLQTGICAAFYAAFTAYYWKAPKLEQPDNLLQETGVKEYATNMYHYSMPLSNYHNAHTIMPVLAGVCGLTSAISLFFNKSKMAIVDEEGVTIGKHVTSWNHITHIEMNDKGWIIIIRDNQDPLIIRSFTTAGGFSHSSQELYEALQFNYNLYAA